MKIEIMKQLIITLIALIMAVSIQAQDFSYLNDIELNDKEQLKEAEEYVLDCCYYLTATRYDKKDVQRGSGSEHPRRFWIESSER